MVTFATRGGCDNVAMSSEGRGRPRLEQSRRPGKTAREEILDAAAELFTTLGYASTSTRRIADAVGIRQASLYHHFATKDDILDALLAGTVDAPLRAGRRTAGRQRARPRARLHLLVATDVDQLCASRWNLGALYLLPELRVPRFEKFHLGRAELRAHYRTLSQQVIAECDGHADAVDLPVPAGRVRDQPTLRRRRLRAGSAMGDRRRRTAHPRLARRRRRSPAGER